MALEAGEAGGGKGLAEAHRALLARRDLQFDFPPYQPPRIPDWLKWLGQALQAVSPLLKYLFWGGLALGVAAILFLIGRELARRYWPQRRPAAAAHAIERPDEALSAELLAEADRLAAEGRYDEAAHLLLFRTIRDLAEREPRFVRPSFTSRDIAAIEAMPSRARSRFAEIAAVVEKSFFAGRAIDRQAFIDCRDAYRAFAAPEAWA